MNSRLRAYQSFNIRYSEYIGGSDLAPNRNAELIPQLLSGSTNVLRRHSFYTNGKRYGVSPLYRVIQSLILEGAEVCQDDVVDENHVDGGKISKRSQVG